MPPRNRGRIAYDETLDSLPSRKLFSFPQGYPMDCFAVFAVAVFVLLAVVSLRAWRVKRVITIKWFGKVK